MALLLRIASPLRIVLLSRIATRHVATSAMRLAFECAPAVLGQFAN